MSTLEYEGILVLNNNSEQVEVVQTGDSSFDSIFFGNHPTRWKVVTMFRDLRMLQKEAALMNLTLKWDVRFQGEELFVVATYEHRGRRRPIKLVWIEGDFWQWEALETYASLDEALGALASILAG